MPVISLVSEELCMYTYKKKHNTMDQNKEMQSCCRMCWHKAGSAWITLTCLHKSQLLGYPAWMP